MRARPRRDGLVSERKGRRGRRILYLCMGSACHQLGVAEVLPKVQALLEHHDMEDRVELKGAFCLGPCGQGIVMRYGETEFKGIRPNNVDEKFEQEILPAIRATKPIEETV